jgi:hypothetical protein
MGCGCKNKTTQTNAGTTQPAQNNNPAPQTRITQTNESVQNSIKKTIEKYYNQNKKR